MKRSRFGLSTGLAIVQSIPSIKSSAPARSCASHDRRARNATGRFHLDLRNFFASQLWARDQARQSDSVRILQIGVDRSHDYAGLHRDEVNADQRNADPGIDDDTFVENPVEHVN